MKRLLLVIAFFTTITAWGSGSLDFTGSWESKNTKGISLDLDLKQTGNKIEGYHVAVVLNTRSHHTDAVLPEDGRPSITGTVSGSKASVLFTSENEATGTATITLQGNKIEWTILSSSSGHLLPKHATLYRRMEKNK